MEGPGDWWYPACPLPAPRPRQHGNPAICAPSPREGQVWAQYRGWYLNRLYSQSCLEPLFTTNARSSSRVLTCSQSHFWAEILSAAHHLSLDGASTSTPSYQMVARSSEDLRSHIWYNWADRHWHWAHIGCQLWEHRMGAWHRDDTGGTGGVASHQFRVTIIWKSNPISELTRNIAASLALTDNSWEPLIFQHSELHFLIWFWIWLAHKLIICLSCLSVTMDSDADPHGYWY